MAKQYTMRRRSVPIAPPSEDVKFTVVNLEKISEDLKSGAIPLPQVTISDEIVSGLRAIIRNSGKISYHINYQVAGGGRFYLKIGDHPYMTLANARKVGQTVKTLAEQGIDPQDGLHERLVRELLEKGEKWRP